MIKQIELPLRGRPILFNTRMITDRIGLIYLFIYLIAFTMITILKKTRKKKYILTRHKKRGTKVQPRDTQQSEAPN